MPYWGPLRWLVFFVLILFIGLPLWLVEKFGGDQDRVIAWFERKLGREAP